MASDKGVPSIILLIGERHLTMPFLDELLFQFLNYLKLVDIYLRTDEMGKPSQHAVSGHHRPSSETPFK